MNIKSLIPHRKPTSRMQRAISALSDVPLPPGRFAAALIALSAVAAAIVRYRQATSTPQEGES